MNALLSILLLIFTLGLASGVSADDARVTVVFADAQKFTDFRTTCVARLVDTQALAGQLERFLQSTAGHLLPDGQRLEVTVTNIDMAGDIEVWRKPFQCDLRTMRDVYPPRVQLSFRLVDDKGTEIRGGSRQLIDLNYLDHAAPSGIDQLRYEKVLLGDWLQRDLGARAGS